MRDDRRLRSDRHPVIWVLLVWVLGIGLLSALAFPYIVERRFPGPDDVLRLVQVRDLLGGQGWFDLHQYRINPPDGVAMHWSRLVDIPLALSILLLEPLVGIAMAEWIVALVLPPLILLAILMIVSRLAWRLFGRMEAIFAAIVLVLWSAFMIQMQPLRIDHHSWQILSVAMALWAISWRSAVRGGATAGIAMALGVVISIEVLPMVAGFGAVLALRWARDYRERIWLAAYMQALALTIVIAFAATRGIPAASSFCDTISLPHIGFFVIAALGTGAIAALPKLPLIMLAILFAFVGALGLGFIALSGPQCFTAPFGVLDPMVRDYWYANVMEGMPIWRQAPDEYLVAIAQMVIALFACTLLILRRRDWQRRWWQEHMLLLVVAALSTIATFRSLYLFAVIAAVPSGWLASRAVALIRDGRSLVIRATAPLLAYIVLLPGGLLTVGSNVLQSEGPAEPSEAAWTEVQLRESACDLGRSTSGLAALPRSTIFAPLDVGPFILLNTPHAVVATGHHRANLAMRDVIAGLTSSPEEARPIVERHQADYVVVCADIAEPHLLASLGGEESLVAGLLSDAPPDWLEPVDLDGPEALKVWRVRKRP